MKSTVRDGRGVASSSLTAITAALFGAAVAIDAAPAQPAITNLGVLPGGSSPRARAVANGGIVVTGSCRNSSGQEVAFRWTQAGGMAALPIFTGGGPPALGLDVSRDGTVVVGNCRAGGQERGFRWSLTPGTTALQPTGERSSAEGVSADGRYMAGFDGPPSGVLAAIWDEQASTNRYLGTFDGGTYSLGLGISSYADAVAGEADIAGGSVRTFRWTEGTGLQDIGIVTGAFFMFFGDISGDGGTIVGAAVKATGNRPYVWRDGAIAEIALPAGASSGSALAVNGDGSVIVGSADTAGGPRAILHSAGLGTVELSTYLATLGVSLTGWVLEDATGISDDGTAIVGNGRFSGVPRSFVVSNLPGCEPEVTDQPDARAECAGGTAQFDVAAIGVGLGYRWFHDGVAIDVTENPSAATPTLMVPVVSSDDEGDYSCSISNGCGAVLSDAATLLVLPAGHPSCGQDCPADLNGDGMVDFADYLEFLNLYDAGDLRVDFNGDGLVDFSDYLEFLNLYGVGC